MYGVPLGHCCSNVLEFYHFDGLLQDCSISSALAIGMSSLQGHIDNQTRPIRYTTTLLQYKDRHSGYHIPL